MYIFEHLVFIIKDIVFYYYKLFRKEIVMSNYNVGFRKSQSIFTHNAVKHKTLNNSINLMRGGIRL